ncbi:hypothetical protein [Caudoviricetes sp.]|nr:hypothetical protein [Caudoviricetes sp.]
MHYYNFNIGDYIKHTMHLSPEEDLCYRRLLDLYYDTEHPIPTEIPRVSRRIRMASEIVQSVLDEFFELTDDGYRNRRADAEIEDYHRYIDKQKANGKLGGRPKKTQPKPTANPGQSQTEPKKSLNNNHTQQPYPENKEKNKALTRPDGVDEQVWKDFTQQRNKLKAPVTQTALEGIAKQAELAGWTLEQALAEITVRGWRGFKAEWVNKGNQAKQPVKDWGTMEDV